jgi:hypothetical protein
LLTDSIHLYAGGSFTEAGATAANDIAEWTGPSGIKQLPGNGAVSVFPNPNNGKFSVSLQNTAIGYTLDIYTATGQRAAQSTLQPGISTLDLTNTARGMYFYRITSVEGDCFASGSIVVQ